MTKWITMILLTGLLIGCGEDSGNNSGGQRPTPGPAELPEWGELQCQRDQTCIDPVLRFEYGYLIDTAFDEFGSVTIETKNGDENLFLCGIKARNFWKEIDGDATSAQNEIYLDFSMRILDLKTCTLKPQIKEILNRYFTESEDYKNEIN